MTRRAAGARGAMSLTAMAALGTLQTRFEEPGR